ncbi:indolepyruvate ferredoxin oxidoreductase family protein [Rhodobium gokarnense]|uniref:Indolepyruvate ferredoxin oxidoreductase n=1 Tax=Rhodobium gokarnense TaxID=364296 RepID=A0ABT3H6M8_9HYPH|nr:indolepyruvate ferredoxin oxidoreductase family protein [Rhodobium gokarnense]MCW2306052.1 indolepyruvate ferredoxin oxidoreductase [Rhodobium gokarnense]
MAQRQVALSDKYDLDQSRIFTTGTQALVRLCLMQQERDRRDGFSTAGYISGYRGSPLGAVDQQFWRARSLLAGRNIRFEAGLNEDLAATAVWGSQQAEMRGEGRFDGVFGIWYGKGPGVDRSGDVFRHANMAGTSPHGGVLTLMGDDHVAESSTTVHQSEFALVDAMMPILSPAGVQEVLDYGLYGWALSRFAGLWVGLKCMKDTIESTGTVDGSIDRVRIVAPNDFELPAGGLNIRAGDDRIAQEPRLHEFKLPAALAFIRSNRLDKTIYSGGRTPRLGIATSGKSYLDVLEALDSLGIDEVAAADLGIRLYKVACTWPLEPDGARQFAEDLQTILVVEEKRGLIEPQLKDILYNTANTPAIYGKKDEADGWLFPAKGALDPNRIAIAIGRRVLAYADRAELAARVAALEAAEERLAATTDIAERIPYFCPGCPHNRSTVVPDGSRAYAGIGCHYMAQWMDRATEGYTQMGGEGANWVGEAPFSTRGHVFQNMGDGTYNHSGMMAIRAAKAAGVTITYKLLYNDAVAMTGGQTHDGDLTVDEIARQVAAIGVTKLAVVSDEPDKYPAGMAWPAGTTVHHRDDLIAVEKDFAATSGLSVLIYDQTCAAEKRRRRKRGTFPDPDRRVFINERVCEGCGDCGVQSNCVAIQAVETEFGRKRQIDQSACNKDFSCLNGFCPSFVTVHGGKLRKDAGTAGDDRDVFADLPMPDIRPLERNYAIMVTGIGGTGVVTIGAILGMAAHLAGKGCGIIDMAGLAQKGGAVTSHIRLAPRPEDIAAIRVPAGDADLVLACDIVVAGSSKVLSGMAPAKTVAVVNIQETLPGDFTRDTDFTLPMRRLEAEIAKRCAEGNSHFVDAQRLATRLFGDAIATNMFMLGYAFQTGAVPLAESVLMEAIALNGVAVEMNQSAFRWGRLAAHDPEKVAARARPAGGADYRRMSEGVEEAITRRITALTEYQDAAYAARFEAALAPIRKAEAAAVPGSDALLDAASRNLFKLMAIKDEFEVARLFTDGVFERELSRHFESWDKLEFHMAPPVIADSDPDTGHLKKARFGSWLMGAMRFLAPLKGLRGGLLDPFSRSAERRMERRLLADYEAVLGEIADGLTVENHASAVALAGYPDLVRGYGHVKEASVKRAEAARQTLLSDFRSGGNAVRQAAE